MRTYISNKDFRRQKTALTRAINSGDPIKVLLTCRATYQEWNDNNVIWPDDWARWRNAWDDALYSLRREVYWP